MAKTVCLLTGPIVGLRSTWFIEDTIKFGAKVGENLVHFNLFDEILHLEGIDSEDAFKEASFIGEILDGYYYQFKDLREKAYYSLARKIDKIPEDTSVIVRTPASIEWRGVLIDFKDHHVIAETINPDRIVTLIDAEWKIKKRLESEYGRHALKVFAHQEELSLSKILEWLGHEVSRSEDWAEWCSQITNKEVDHIVLGIEAPGPAGLDSYIRDVDNLLKLATQKELTTFYASYSMTVADPKIRKIINDSVWKLREYGVVIDPASIEIDDTDLSDEKDAVFAYTICRDLRWDVQKVDIVAAFHPYDDLPPMSTGMIDELGHARAFRKERYLVMPTGTGSPFTKDNFVAAEHVFKTSDELFNYLEKHREPPLSPRFQHYESSIAKGKKSK